MRNREPRTMEEPKMRKSTAAVNFRPFDVDGFDTVSVQVTSVPSGSCGIAGSLMWRNSSLLPFSYACGDNHACQQNVNGSDNIVHTSVLGREFQILLFGNET